MNSSHRLLQGLATAALALGSVGCGGTSAGASGPLVSADAQPAPNVAWAKSIDGNGMTVLSAVQAFPDGSTVAIGYMAEQITFKTGGTEPTLTPLDGVDGYLVRYDSDGTFAWARRLAGLGYAGPAHSVAVMTDGEIMIAGYYGYGGGTLTLGEGDATEVTHTSAGDDDIFVARYAGTGELLWSRSVGSTSADQAIAMTALPSGAAAITGMVGGTVTFGASETNETVLSETSYEGFVARYEPDGTLGWATGTSSGGYAIGWGVAQGSSGAVLVTGTMAGSVTFGFGEAGEVTMSSMNGSDDVFLASLASDGTVQWVRTAGGDSFDEVYGLASAADGSVRLVGGFYATATFGSEGSTPVDLVAPAGSENAFIASYDANGDLLWAHQSESDVDDGGSLAFSVAVGSDGTSFVVGRFSGTMTLRYVDDSTTSATSVGGTDGFVARYLDNGDLDWAMTVSSFGDDSAMGVTVLGDLSVTVGGYYEGDVTFGAGDANETSFSDTGNMDAFIAKYNPAGGF